MKLIVLAFVFNFILNCWPKTNIINPFTCTCQSAHGIMSSVVMHGYCYFGKLDVALKRIRLYYERHIFQQNWNSS